MIPPRCYNSPSSPPVSCSYLFPFKHISPIHTLKPYRINGRPSLSFDRYIRKAASLLRVAPPSSSRPGETHAAAATTANGRQSNEADDANLASALTAALHGDPPSAAPTGSILRHRGTISDYSRALTSRYFYTPPCGHHLTLDQHPYHRPSPLQGHPGKPLLTGDQAIRHFFPSPPQLGNDHSGASLNSHWGNGPRSSRLQVLPRPLTTLENLHPNPPPLLPPWGLQGPGNRLFCLS